MFDANEYEDGLCYIKNLTTYEVEDMEITTKYVPQ